MKKSFSLAELIITMAVIGILTAILVPAISSYLPFWRLNGSARLIVNKLRQAQEEAVTIQNQHLIRFNPTASPCTYELIKIDIDENTLETIETVLETITMPTNVTLSLDPTIADNQIIFSADGGPSSNGNLTVTLGDASKTINVSPAGVIRLQ